MGREGSLDRLAVVEEVVEVVEVEDVKEVKEVEEAESDRFCLLWNQLGGKHGPNDNINVSLV
jgi:hypothetical protein